MAQTLFSSYFHIVFSTKNRFDFIQPDIEDELFAYIGGIIRNFDGKLLRANGTSNHCHLLVSMSKNTLVPDLIGAVKRESSKWIKTKGGMYSKFGWQDGYSAFSVGYSQISVVEKYISNQKEHHKKICSKTKCVVSIANIKSILMRNMSGISSSLTGTRFTVA